MDIQLHQITIRELAEGYWDSNENGVRGYGGKLDIRPAYQREFIYKDKQREAVIETVEKNFPLNVMYWAKREGDAEVPYEVMDGQQRTISICQFVNGEFSHNFRFFHNLLPEEKEAILNYPLMVYICSGTDKEKLAWFETINIAGEKLFEQELRNAVYAGPFVTSAKQYFSKTNCPAYNLGKDLLNGSPIRQDYLETVLKWKARNESKSNNPMHVEDYMALHQHDPNANQLWQYFHAVISWVNSTFNVRKFKKIMKGTDWGLLYDEFHEQILDTKAIEAEMSRLSMDSEVQKKSGICAYVLNRDEHELGLRAFPDDIKWEVYEKQHHHCVHPDCPYKDKEFEFDEMEGDHIIPWHDGGKTVVENCQMLCRDCNRRKGGK